MLHGQNFLVLSPLFDGYFRIDLFDSYFRIERFGGKSDFVAAYKTRGINLRDQTSEEVLKGYI